MRIRLLRATYSGVLASIRPRRDCRSGTREHRSRPHRWCSSSARGCSSDRTATSRRSRGRSGTEPRFHSCDEHLAAADERPARRGQQGSRRLHMEQRRTPRDVSCSWRFAGTGRNASGDPHWCSRGHERSRGFVSTWVREQSRHRRVFGDGAAAPLVMGWRSSALRAREVKPKGVCDLRMTARRKRRGQTHSMVTLPGW
jgi:hypothetical protein